MDNPFRKRATEFLRDDEAFLSIVSPEPITFYLRRPGQAGTLYDRMVLVRGTPGSGKTTLARLFEFSTLASLLKNSSTSTYQALVAALSECGALSPAGPAVLGCRLPLETDYREFWEFPYTDNLKLGLMTALLQSRAVLAWLRHLKAAGVEPEDVRIVPRPGAEAIVDAIGGTGGIELADRARDVERALYEVVGALIPPDESRIAPKATGAYRPFDVIDRVIVTAGPASARYPLELRPLVILDDAHNLHPTQFRALERWLARRELRIARWVIARFDVLLPQEVLPAVAEDRAEAVDYPGLKADREVEVVLLQSSGARREHRTNFRRMAKDMARRYLRRMPIFSARNLAELGDLLGDHEQTISPSRVVQLQAAVDAAQRKFGISDERRSMLYEQVRAFKVGGKVKGREVAEDVALAMLAVLLHRHKIRTKQQSLFEAEEGSEPSRPVNANDSVYDAAMLHLLHTEDRPFYFGIDDLCDAASENVEQFLQLAAILVETSATQIIRSKPALLTPGIQNKLLRQRGERMMDAWDFPEHQQVRRLVARIAERCVEVTLEPNGWDTPNALGIPQVEFERLPETHAGLARVLQFAVAYNAIMVVPRRECKEKQWCLLELGGMVILKYGLTLKRGNFVEGTVQDLAQMLEEPGRE